MQKLKRVRYRTFIVGLVVGNTSLLLWLLDYFLRFRPDWVAGTADRLFGFGPFHNYLRSGYALFLVASSVFGLWLACLMWLLPGRLSDCRRP